MADKKERRGLGRGLSALMADVAPVENDADAPRAVPDTKIAIDQIVPNPDQPRRVFDKQGLADLAASIREKGVIQPLVLRPDPTHPKQYQIVAGERRWRASQIAQLHTVPAIVRDLDDSEVLEIAIIENIQRSDLNPIEEAQGYRQLMDKFGHTQERLAESLGKSRSHIANTLRLITLSQDIQDLVLQGLLTAGHARALLTAQDPSELAQRIVRQGLSVRETEKLAKSNGNRRSKSPSPQKDADTRALEGDLKASLGMTVQIEHGPNGSGALSVRYKSLEELDELCKRLSAVSERD